MSKAKTKNPVSAAKMKKMPKRMFFGVGDSDPWMDWEDLKLELKDSLEEREYYVIYEPVAVITVEKQDFAVTETPLR